MIWWKTQFDKMLMAALLLIFCVLAIIASLCIPASFADKLVAFFLQAGSGVIGCLLTLVTARRGLAPDPAEPNTTVTTMQKTTVGPAEPSDAGNTPPQSRQ